MQIKQIECFKEMEIPSAGISWLYTAGFISSAVDMEKNMSSYSPYGKYDVGKRGKQLQSLLFGNCGINQAKDKGTCLPSWVAA